jgi:hypothetical protein
VVSTPVREVLPQPATPSNWLRQIRFEGLEKVSVAIRGLVNRPQRFVVELPERPRQVCFAVARLSAGPFTIQVVVDDDCGSRPSFVGAGTSEF